MNILYTTIGLAFVILSVYGYMNNSLEAFDDYFIVPASNLLMLPFCGGVVLFLVGMLMDHQIAKWEKDFEVKKK